MENYVYLDQMQEEWKEAPKMIEMSPILKKEKAQHS